MNQCKENPDCVGVSVTNSEWGDRPPWCHLCISRNTRAHQNLDTYWMDELTPMEAQERRLKEELHEISRIEANLCSDPQKVSRSDFEKVKQQDKVHADLKETQDKVAIEHKELIEKLEAERKELTVKYEKAMKNYETAKTDDDARE